MKISQLMTRLNKLKALHGDVNVFNEYEDNDVSSVYISSQAMEEYDLDENEKPSIRQMKDDGYTDEDIKDMVKKYVIID